MRSIQVLHTDVFNNQSATANNIDIITITRAPIINRTDVLTFELSLFSDSGTLNYSTDSGSSWTNLTVSNNISELKIPTPNSDYLYDSVQFEHIIEETFTSTINTYIDDNPPEYPLLTFSNPPTVNNT